MENSMISRFIRARLVIVFHRHNDIHFIMEKELITALALGIGLSASTGFRVFIPLLIGGIASRFGFLQLSESFFWLASNTALMALGFASIIEISAYYIPFIDNLLDTITTPLAIGAGTLLSASILPVDNEIARWVIGFIVGGGASTAVQVSTTLLRIGSIGTTGGLGNSLVASGENVASVVTPILSLILPLLMAAIIVISLFFIVRLFFNKRTKRKS